MELGSFPLWGNKFLCRDDVDLLARDGSESCTVVSVGSGNEWSFEEDVHRHFAERFEVEHLAKTDLEDERGRGLSWITSSVYKLTRV